MVLDTLSEQRINIKDLVLQEPGKKPVELMFDPDTDIPSEAWQQIGRSISIELERFKNHPGEWQDYLTMSANAVLLSPQRKQIIAFDEASSYGLLESIKTTYGKPNPIPTSDLYQLYLSRPWFRLFQQLKDLNIIDPTNRRLFERLVGGKKLDGSLEMVEEELFEEREHVFDDWVEDKSRLFLLLNTGASIKIYSPEKFGYIRNCYDENLFDLVPETLKVIKKYFSSNPPPSHPDFTQNNADEYVNYAFVASSSRILYPDKYSSIKLSYEDWDNFKKTLEWLESRKQWSTYTNLAVSMKMLAAEELRFSEQGLELVMPPSQPKTEITEPIPSLPNLRKF